MYYCIRSYSTHLTVTRCNYYNIHININFGLFVFTFDFNTRKRLILSIKNIGYLKYNSMCPVLFNSITMYTIILSKSPPLFTCNSLTIHVLVFIVYSYCQFIIIMLRLKSYHIQILHISYIPLNINFHMNFNVMYNYMIYLSCSNISGYNHSYPGLHVCYIFLYSPKPSMCMNISAMLCGPRLHLIHNYNLFTFHKQINVNVPKVLFPVNCYLLGI